MSNRLPILAATAALLLAATAAPAAGSLAEIPVFANAQPEVNGTITDAEKSGAAALKMTTLGSLDKPKHDTTVYVGMTTSALYVGFDCPDPAPDKLVTNITERNGAVFTDDSVQVLVAPENEATSQNYYHFAVNAAGVPYSINMAFEEEVHDWTSAVAKTPTGWQAEFLIPFRSIRGKTTMAFWRANFARVRAAREGEPEDTTVWSDPATTIHNFKRFGFLRLTTPDARQIATTPTATAITPPRTDKPTTVSAN